MSTCAHRQLCCTCVWLSGGFKRRRLTGRGEVTAAAWECSLVRIRFVSSIWLIGLIVEEDPFNRVSRTLSRERNLAGFRPLNSGDAALHPAVTGLTAAKSRSGRMPRISRPQPACDRRFQLQFAEMPNWRVSETLSKGLLKLC